MRGETVSGTNGTKLRRKALVQNELWSIHRVPSVNRRKAVTRGNKGIWPARRSDLIAGTGVRFGVKIYASVGCALA